MKNVGRILLSIFLAINAIFLIVGCGNQGFNPDSIPTPAGKLSAPTSAYPGVVEVIMPGGLGLCSGSVISSRAVLTAAHCLQTNGTYMINASFGTYETATRVVLGSGAVSDTSDMGVLIFNEDITTDPGTIYGFGPSVAVGQSVTLVGFGCTDVNTRLGAGTKRVGTNAVNEVSDFIYLLTPVTSTSPATSAVTGTMTSRIIGDANQSGTCFGDSGGPLFTSTASGQLQIVGITHAGGTSSQYDISEFVNVVGNPANVQFLQSTSQTYSLTLSGL